jgi:ClpP class serine protease
VHGVLTSFKDATELPGVEGDIQKALDMLADGYNLWAREQALDTDEFGTLLDAIDWAAVAKNAKAEDKKADDGRVTLAVDFVKGQFKRSARAIAAQSGMDIPEVVTLLSNKLPKLAPVTA